MSSAFKNYWNFFVDEIKTQGSYLVPMRMFMGIAWITVGVEKVVSDDWFSGEAIAQFLTSSVASGAVKVPAYEYLIENIFLPHAHWLLWVVVIGQFLVGLGILLGTFTNAALLGGLLMNLNFILCGRINPSVFYMLIETVLFLANTGAILGFDKYLCRRIPFEICVAQRHDVRPNIPVERWSYLGIVGLSLLFAAFMLSCVSIQEFSIASPKKDSAVVLTMLGALGGFGALCKYVSIRGS